MLTSALQQFGPFCIIIDYSTLFVLNSKTIKSQKRFLYEKFSRKNIFLPRLNSGSFGCRRSSYEDPVKNGVAANSLFLWWRHQWKAEMTHKNFTSPLKDKPEWDRQSGECSFLSLLRRESSVSAFPTVEQTAFPKWVLLRNRRSRYWLCELVIRS